jgi:hypothetical protein
MQAERLKTRAQQRFSAEIMIDSYQWCKAFFVQRASEGLPKLQRFDADSASCFERKLFFGCKRF